VNGRQTTHHPPAPGVCFLTAVERVLYPGRSYFSLTQEERTRARKLAVGLLRDACVWPEAPYKANKSPTRRAA
jgi:hypothetical protein